MRAIPLFLFVLMIGGCATYHSLMIQARQKMADGEPLAAAEMIEAKTKEEGKDQVLYLLDYGLALHQAKDYPQSNKTFIAADHLAEVKDYISVSRQAGSLLLNEGLLQYKTERFENILINAYLALNFTLQNNFEDALVECRRMDEKIYKMKYENEDLRKNFYARYLSAMIWEAQKNWDSAYIDYLNAYNINPNLQQLSIDLIRSAWRARRYDELKKWQKQFPSVSLNTIKKEVKTKGELVFIFQQGWIPKKRPRPENFRFPYLVPQYSGIKTAKVMVGTKLYPSTELLYDVGSEAIRTLDADYAYLVAKKVLGVIAKEVVADQIRQKNEGLGAIAAIVMHAADQADLRQWGTLPDTFQLSRIHLPPGEHEISLMGFGPVGEVKMWTGKVNIKAGKKTFITHRSFH